MTYITIRVDRELFRWDTFQVWVNHAARDFRRARAGGDLPTSGGYICIDHAGYICDIGKDFMAARDAGRFPVIVWKTEDPFLPNSAGDPSGVVTGSMTESAGFKSDQQLYAEMIERIRKNSPVTGCVPKEGEQVLFHHAWGGKFRGFIQINKTIISCDLAAIVPSGLVVGWEMIPAGYVSPFDQRNWKKP